MPAALRLPVPLGTHPFNQAFIQTGKHRFTPLRAAWPAHRP